MFAASRLRVPSRIDNNLIAAIAREGRVRSPSRGAIPARRSRSDRPTTYQIGRRSKYAKNKAHYSARAAPRVSLWLHHGFVRMTR